MDVLTFNEIWNWLDTTLFTPTNPATGSAWAVGTQDSFQIVQSQANPNETSRLVSVDNIACSPGRLNGAPALMKRFIIEFEMQLVNPSNVDNTLAFFGLSVSNAADRSTNDIIGFILDSDVFKGIADSGGAETLTTVAAAPGSMQKFQMMFEGNKVSFYVDDTLLGTLTPATISDLMYLNFFVDTEAGGNATLQIGELRWGFETSRISDELYDMIPLYTSKISTDQEFFVYMFDRDGKPVKGIADTELTVEYAEAIDSAWTSYTATGQWTEVDDGVYVLNIGASEFDTSDTHFIVRVEHDSMKAKSCVFVVKVHDNTFDEVIDMIEAIQGGDTTINITDMSEDNRKFSSTNESNQSDIRALVVKTKNGVARLDERMKSKGI